MQISMCDIATPHLQRIYGVSSSLHSRFLVGMTFCMKKSNWFSGKVICLFTFTTKVVALYSRMLKLVISLYSQSSFGQNEWHRTASWCSPQTHPGSPPAHPPLSSSPAGPCFPGGEPSLWNINVLISKLYTGKVVLPFTPVLL